ncbi:hypothetical protein LTR37_008306 [Vermiconidia calcicola]|uniref:Uncharacterized protein n=1 Tax=Vermiconidia calcicola TaxID=1690605 RepID=A0ACC3NCH9_9PEZI|nr:hypothetical protein LTR37_008306 [Vermiconidia calcicola]
MIDYFGEKDLTSEHAFVPSRPPPARRPNGLSALPSYYGEQQYDKEATLHAAPFDSAEDTQRKRSRKRNWAAIIMMVVVVACVAIIPGLVVAQSQKHDPHAGPAADAATTSPQSVPRSILTEIARGPEIVTKYTSSASFLEATYTPVLVQASTIDIPEAIMTSVPNAATPIVVRASATSAA